MKKGFIFDLNKCVGCHACVVGCQIENSMIQNQAWREINTFNTNHHPDIPLFHFSLACNNCEEAPCMKGCPALAYEKDKGIKGIETIIHYSDRCIGCKYCTWTCPYDAPKFIQTKGIVEKCTLCYNRISKDLKPSCANHCPTGALNFGEIDNQNPNIEFGFSEVNIKPGIEIIPLRNRQGSRHNQKLSKEEQEYFQLSQSQPQSKIKLQREFPLVIFTLLAAILTAMIADFSFRGSMYSPLLFTALGLLGMGLSSVHLGKKFRAWRSVLNIRNSWLSREIMFYIIFMLLSVTALFFPNQKTLAFIALLLGFTSLYAIDKVYKFIPKTSHFYISSSSVFLSGLLFTTCFMSNIYWIGILLAIKFILYVYQKVYYYSRGEPVYPIISVLRLLIGILIPILLLVFSVTESPYIVIGLVIVGEIIDRSEFYHNLEVTTPMQQIWYKMIESLKN